MVVLVIDFVEAACGRVPDYMQKVWGLRLTHRVLKIEENLLPYNNMCK